MKRIVRRPMRRRRSASAITALISLMPLSTALKGMNSQRVARAIRWASVVLPTPGRPPQNDRGQLVALDLAAQRLAGTENVLLPDVVFQACAGACARRAAAGLSVRLGLGRRGIEEAHGVQRSSGAALHTAECRRPRRRSAIPRPRWEWRHRAAAERHSPETPRASLPMIKRAAAGEIRGRERRRAAVAEPPAWRRRVRRRSAAARRARSRRPRRAGTARGRAIPPRRAASWD